MRKAGSVASGNRGTGNGQSPGCKACFVAVLIKKSGFCCDQKQNARMARKQSLNSDIILEISEIFEQGRDGAAESSNKHVLYANWKIGAQIRLREQNGNQRADYGTRLLARLAQDLNEKYGRGFSKSNLSNMRKFNELYQLREISNELTWSHYRTLITVEDTRQRKQYQQKCIKDGLSQRQLHDLLRDDAGRKRSIKRPGGKTGTYRITQKPAHGRSRQQAHFDLGFGVYADYLFDLLPEARRLHVFRVRERSVLKGKRGISEKKMFGGLCLLSDEKMVCGVMQNEIMLRVGPERGAVLLKEKGIRPMNFTGKPMDGFLYASRAKIEDGAELSRLIDIAWNTWPQCPKKRRRAAKKASLWPKKRVVRNPTNCALGALLFACARSNSRITFNASIYKIDPPAGAGCVFLIMSNH